MTKKRQSQLDEALLQLEELNLNASEEDLAFLTNAGIKTKKPKTEKQLKEIENKKMKRDIILVLVSIPVLLILFGIVGVVFFVP